MNDNPPSVRPVSVQDVSDYDPLHGMVRAKRVNYRLHDGTQSYVVVPLSQYNKETVERKLHEALMQHADVMGVNVTPHSVPVTDSNPWS